MSIASVSGDVVVPSPPRPVRSRPLKSGPKLRDARGYLAFLEATGLTIRDLAAKFSVQEETMRGWIGAARRDRDREAEAAAEGSEVIDAYSGLTRDDLRDLRETYHKGAKFEGVPLGGDAEIEAFLKRLGSNQLTEEDVRGIQTLRQALAAGDVDDLDLGDD